MNGPWAAWARVGAEADCQPSGQRKTIEAEGTEGNKSQKAKFRKEEGEGVDQCFIKLLTV